MTADGVYGLEMHDEIRDPRVHAFLDELRSASRAGAVPAPSPELESLFTSGLPVAVARPQRRAPMFREVMTTMRARLAAAALASVAFAGGMATAGALPAPVQLAASRMAGSVGVELPGDETGNDTVTGDETGLAAPEPAPVATVTPAPTETVAAPAASEEAPAGLPAVPTSVSEAAHIHDFDEACGNHGAYVSHVARTGDEPECATAARAGGTGSTNEAAPAPKATEGEDAPKAEARGRGGEAKERGPKAKPGHPRGKSGSSPGSGAKAGRGPAGGKR